jgi:DNA-directed RNA polymerase subunit RPC12/RpoP
MPEMRLLKCPACGGPLEPPRGEAAMKCTYCGNAVVIPESLRAAPETAASPQVNLFSGIDMNAMVGYGAQWSEVVQLAQSGRKEEAIRKYMALTGNSESSARYMVDNLSGAQFYDSQAVQQMYAPYMNTVAETVKTTTRWSLWLGCGITALTACIILVTVIPALIGVFASVWASLP